FYGRQVRILQRHRKGGTLSCLIAAPDNPELHYRLPARWLSPTPPLPAAAPVRGPTAIALPLAALDTLTQNVLALSRCPEDACRAPISTPTRDARADLAP